MQQLNSGLFYHPHHATSSMVTWTFLLFYAWKNRFIIKYTPSTVKGQGYYWSFQMGSVKIQRGIIMAFLCMSTYAGGTKLRFRWVNVKYQNDVKETTHKECHIVSDLALCYWYLLYFKIIHKLYLIFQYLWHYTRWGCK